MVKAIIRTAEFLLNLFFVLLYIGALLSGVVSPLRTQVPAFLNLAFGFLLLFLVLLWLFYLIRRKWLYVGFYTLLFIISSGYIFTYFPIHFGKGLKQERNGQVRVMTYNVMRFYPRDEISKRHRAVDFILSIDADIVALQEGNFIGNEAQNKKMLREVFGKVYPHIFTSGANGQTLLSKYPILHTEEIEYPSYTNGSFAHVLQLPNGEEVLVVNNHMESYALQQGEKEEYKEYLTDIKLKSLPQQLRKVKNRLGPKLNVRAYGAERVRSEVVRLSERYEPKYILVMGDLNDTPNSYCYRQVRHKLRDAYAETGFGPSPTFNEMLFRFRIDHMFYSGEGMKALGSEIPRRPEISDHNPLIVDFCIKSLQRN